MKFEIKDRDAAGRICKFTTNHGTVTTPNLMPVINPNRMIITPKEMKKLFGTEIVITNSYIINKNDNLRSVALEKGVHSLIDFDGLIMTDSGTFQSYMYGDVDVDPLEIVEFQKNIGVDIGTILDIFGTPDQTKTKASKGVEETVKRAKESMKIKGDMILSCPVQGSIYPDLRTKCAKQLSDLGGDFFPIGGVVPLMEKQMYSDLVSVILASKKGLNPSKPVHLFGCGHPLVFPLAVALGCDLFDSSAYAKYANDGRMIFYWGTEKLEDISELPCSCPVCSKYSASELKKLDKKIRDRELAKHNLYVSFEELRKIRNAIQNGNLWELVERRANCNPFLLEAMNILRNEDSKKWLERYEPLSKNKALFYTGTQTIHRPIVYRTHQRLLSRYKPWFKTTVVFSEQCKPFSSYYIDEKKKITRKNNCINFIVDSSIGPVPFDLDEMYPFAQSVFPTIIDGKTEEYLTKLYDEFVKDLDVYSWTEDEILENIPDGKLIDVDYDINRISSVADMQFGSDAGKNLLNGDIKFVKSKKTHKIRNIFCNDKHVLSMRAGDGFFTLKKDGAIILHKNLKKPNLRVVIDDDAIPFVKDGKSVFAKFVKDCDKSLRPMDECLIVDKKDNLLAVGRCIMNREEMLSFEYGMAVKTREYFKD